MTVILRYSNCKEIYFEYKGQEYLYKRASLVILHRII